MCMVHFNWKKFHLTQNKYFWKYIFYLATNFQYVCTYVCISLYSLPFTGFESLPEISKNKSLKIT